MHNFSDFDIKAEVKTFVGDKIPVKKILNIQIKIIDFKIEPSKLFDGTDCLYLQIEKNGEKRVVFSGSKILMNQIKRVPEGKFPFTTTIKGDNDYYEFT
jgi:hypothetical protein